LKGLWLLLAAGCLHGAGVRKSRVFFVVGVCRDATVCFQDAVETSIDSVVTTLLGRLDGASASSDGMRQLQDTVRTLQDQLGASRKSEAALKSRLEELDKARPVSVHRHLHFSIPVTHATHATPTPSLRARAPSRYLRTHAHIRFRVGVRGGWVGVVGGWWLGVGGWGLGVGGWGLGVGGWGLGREVRS
jgi:hypothetical protein